MQKIAQLMKKVHDQSVRVRYRNSNGKNSRVIKHPLGYPLIEFRPIKIRTPTSLYKDEKQLTVFWFEFCLGDCLIV